MTAPDTPYPMPGFRIRDGKPADLAALCEIETRAFASDHLSLRNFRRMIVSPSAHLRVAVVDAEPLGYHLVLTRAGSTVARLYSIAVAATAHGQGLGAGLLADAERQARRAGATVLRLEVRPDNAGAIRLYGQRGYERIGTHRAYYADKSDALRYQKKLRRTAGRGARSQRSHGDPDEDRSPPEPGRSTRILLNPSSAASGRPAPAGWRRAADRSMRGAVNG
jgi:[ribosomal protein S18]-alanine N-acetyltransferase